MMAFDDALEAVLAMARPTGVERVDLAQAEGRVLAAPLVARVCSHSFTTLLNVVAHAHALAAMPNGWMLEWPVKGLADWAVLFPGAPLAHDGQFTVPDAPGWGLRPDPAALDRYRMPR